MISSNILEKTRENIKSKLEQIETLQERIVILDGEKADYDNAITNIDNQLLGEIKIVNDAYQDVFDTYQDAIVSGCKTDMFWRVYDVDWDSGESEYEYSLVCTKLNAGGYPRYDAAASGGVGIGTTITIIAPGALNNLAGIQTYPINTGAEQRYNEDPTKRVPRIGFTSIVDGSKFGFRGQNKYALQIYDEPYTKDIGDTFKASFIGTMAVGSDKLTVMEPVGAGISEEMEVGYIVVPDREGVFNGTVKITGITTGLVDLRDVPNLTGITTYSQFVNILTLDQTPSLPVILNDDTFTSFKLLGDPDTAPLVAIGTVTSNGNTYGISKTFDLIPTTASMRGYGSLVKIITNTDGGISQVIPQTGGEDYAVGEILTVDGTLLGVSTTSTADDLTFPVTTVAGDDRFRYRMHPWDSNPFVPQEVGILSTSNVGAGISIKLDDTGHPPASQSWDPNEAGFIVEYSDRGKPLAGPVTEPLVGGGKVYYPVGFSSRPMRVGSVAEEGEILTGVTEDDFSQLYEDLPACSSDITTAITNAIGIASEKETSFLNKTGTNNILIDTTNALRIQRNELSLRIWGNRQAVSKLNLEYDGLVGFNLYMGVSIPKNIIDNV